MIKTAARWIKLTDHQRYNEKGTVVVILRHITRHCLLIIFLSETEPRGAFVLDGESNEPHIGFPQPISQKMYLTGFRNEPILIRTLGQKAILFYLAHDNKLKQHFI